MWEDLSENRQEKERRSNKRERVEKRERERKTNKKMNKIGRLLLTLLGVGNLEMDNSLK